MIEGGPFNLVQPLSAEPGRTDVLQLTLRTSLVQPPVPNFDISRSRPMVSLRS
jgi:hypothetical protein